MEETDIKIENKQRVKEYLKKLVNREAKKLT